MGDSRSGMGGARYKIKGLSILYEFFETILVGFLF